MSQSKIPLLLSGFPIFGRVSTETLFFYSRCNSFHTLTSLCPTKEFLSALHHISPRNYQSSIEFDFDRLRWL
jgi:hypothetical protein